MRVGELTARASRPKFSFACCAMLRKSYWLILGVSRTESLSGIRRAFRELARSGREGLFPCSFCEGEGPIEEEETVRVRIPPMVGDGALMEILLHWLGVYNFYLRCIFV